MARKKPVAGIVVALVLAGINILWSCVAFAVGPTTREVVLYNAFPGLESIALMSTSAWIIGSAALVIGAILAQLDHSAGTATVRATSWAMIAYILLATIMILNCCHSAPAWNRLNEVEQLNVTSGLVGAAIGGVLQFGLILLMMWTIFPNQGRARVAAVLVAVGAALTLHYGCGPVLLASARAVQ